MWRVSKLKLKPFFVVIRRGFYTAFFLDLGLVGLGREILRLP